jgi:predicted membrane channel-forming protein YqfA (hemolysin III family)
VKADSGDPAEAPQAGGRYFRLPGTKFGRWSFLLALIFVVLWLINTMLVGGVVVVPDSWNRVVMPIFGIFMLLCGLVSGVFALIAVIRQHEKSWLVWLPLLVGLFMLFLLVGEFLIPPGD